MIAVDTNILVYAHRTDSPHHAPALEALRSLAAGGRTWAVPWPCVHEFLSTVTHQRIYRPPSTVGTAVAAMQDLLAMRGVTTLGEDVDHPSVIARLLNVSGVTGPKVHDARIAAICLSHGVSELWTADRDFSYFQELRTRNPLVG